MITLANGLTYGVDGPQSFTGAAYNPVTDVVRLEVLPGEPRCELSGYPRLVPKGVKSILSFDHMMEDWGPITDDWTILFQAHPYPSGGQQCASLEVPAGGGVQRFVNHSAGGYVPMGLDRPVTRGKWINYYIEAVFHDTAGRLLVLADGAKAVDYTGPLGRDSEAGYYWKLGVYRGGKSRMAVQIRGLRESLA